MLVTLKNRISQRFDKKDPGTSGDAGTAVGIAIDINLLRRNEEYSRHICQPAGSQARRSRPRTESSGEPASTTTPGPRTKAERRSHPPERVAPGFLVGDLTPKRYDSGYEPLGPHLVYLALEELSVFVDEVIESS